MNVQVAVWLVLLALAVTSPVPTSGPGERIDVFESMVASVCGAVEVRTERSIRVVTIVLEVPFRIIGSADSHATLSRPVRLERVQLLAPSEVLAQLAGGEKVCGSGRLTRRSPGRLFEAAALDASLGAVTLGTPLAEAAEAAPADPLERHMIVLGVAPERTTLEAALMILGPTEIRWNGGDAAGSANCACYVGPDGTTLVLVSNTEMGGGSVITNLQLLEREAHADFSSDTDYDVPVNRRPRCGSLPTLSRATSTAGGLRLGMSVDDVRRLMGTPESESADAIWFSSQASLQDDDMRAREVRVLVKAGTVIGIHVNQVTSS